MRHKTVKTKDVRNFQQALDDLLDRPEGTEGMGVLWGPPGTGKSTSLAYFTNAYDGIFIRALTCSTVTSLLGDICTALGWVSSNPNKRRMLRKADMVEFIIRKLTRGESGEPDPLPRPIFVDEADYCFRQFELMDILRDIYDLSGCPVIFVGMEDIARKIKEQGRFARRITQWIEYKGLDLEDTIQVSSEVCDIELSRELIEYVHKETSGNIGRQIIALTRIERHARATNKTLIDLGTWGDRPLYFDQPTFARKRISA
jgi:DNA transposition AAA+ family ATPase